MMMSSDLVQGEKEAAKILQFFVKYLSQAETSLKVGCLFFLRVLVADDTQGP